MFVGHKCCARGKTSQHLRNVITSAMLPPQCVLVLPGPKANNGKRDKDTKDTETRLVSASRVAVPVLISQTPFKHIG